ncbi:hypothetical protein [Azospirillum doebereinerae]
MNLVSEPEPALTVVSVVEPVVDPTPVPDVLKPIQADPIFTVEYDLAAAVARIVEDLPAKTSSWASRNHWTDEFNRRLEVEYDALAQLILDPGFLTVLTAQDRCRAKQRAGEY